MALKVRDLIKVLSDQGAQPVRTKGSHQTWVTESGARIVVVVNHMNVEAGPNTLKQVRRAGIKI